MILVQVNCPDRDTALTIGRALVSERLAASANIGAGIESLYHWDGGVTDATEVPLSLKTHDTLFERVSARITALHPYDVPAILALTVATTPATEAWIAVETRSDRT